ncbi:MAG: multidrug resistance protein [Anaerolineales bacterium]|nr:multidrug resistance protein [Anaerolineales bacterium]
MKERVLPTLWLIGLSIAMNVLGQTAIKLGVNQPESEALTAADPISVVSLVVRSPMIMLGLLMHVVGALAWIVVLSRLDLSYAYPFVAVNFVLITVVSQVVFSETVPTLRWLGIALVCVGLVLVALSAKAG